MHPQAASAVRSNRGEKSRLATPATPPGAEAYPAELAGRLAAALADLGRGYQPRTEHQRADGTPMYVNRLILAHSPYLRQHAHNPVDWHPWGAEAFARARREDKPVFLSIGYSTCHWCHVMERESFDDEEVARLLNQWFVSVKVDREQLPAVDEVYMTAAQVLGERGGWPLTVLLTADGKPFFGGTYFPRADFIALLRKWSVAWQRRRPALLGSAERTAAAVARLTAAASGAAAVDDHLLAGAVRRALARHDDRRGGFTPAPKFPREPELLFLLDRALRTGDGAALAAVETTLDRMARGGIHDQVGGGFHRYAVDADWLVPHFEKMLHSQALLARAYVEAWRLGGGPLFDRVARQTLDYVLRDMTSADGAFYSATDADSDGREGGFFVWTPAQIRRVLSAADAELAIGLFGVTEEGNFAAASVLHLATALPAAAAAEGLPLAELLERIDGIRGRLLEARQQRVHPLRDEKVITAWNAQMITTLAQAGEALGAAPYVAAARRAAELLWQRHRRDDGGLWRVYLDGAASTVASQDDYACFVEALVALYDATGERLFLERAQSVADVMIDRFWDEAAGGFFLSQDDDDGRLPVRPKGPVDADVPSGNSVAVRALAMLADRTGEESYRRRAQAAVAAFSGAIKRQTGDFAYMLLGAAELLHGGAGPTAYAARGVVRARAKIDGDAATERRLTLHLDVADGWHVNSDRPLQETLVATRLTAVGDTRLSAVEYPAAQRLTLGFQQQPVAVFEGRVPIRGIVGVGEAEGPPIARLRLTVQACDDRKCLPPEDLLLELPLTAAQ